MKNLVSTAFLVLAFVSLVTSSFSQNLYTARGYWEETTKPNYLAIQKKIAAGDSLTTDEKLYVKDTDAFLATYFQRLSPDEKLRYDNMKPQWDQELTAKNTPRANDGTEDFEYRGRDRLASGFYGAWYGASLVVITGASDAAAVGIPLLTTGLWMMGPAIVPKKYEGLTRNDVRAFNTGRILGIAYGASLGLAIAGDGESSGELAFGLSTVSSIAMGEIGLSLQKKKAYSAGRIEMIKHYGFLGPWIGFSGAFATGSSSVNLYGAGLVAGGIAGVAIGNSVGKKYDYTRGDVDLVQSLTLISTGIGFTAVAETTSETQSLILIPAAASIIGTMIGQGQVKNVHFTEKQGTTTNMAAGGAAVIGLGIAALTSSDHAAVYIGVPSVMALIVQQGLLHKYKVENLAGRAQGRLHRKKNFHTSVKVSPESYFLNQRIPIRNYSPETLTRIHQPIVRLTVKF